MENNGVVQKVKDIFAWLRKNERHISAPMFVAGFISDLLTVAPLSLSYAIYLYGFYLLVSAFATIGSHYLFVRDAQEGPFLKGFRIVLSLAAQFTTGGLLSGFLIFYTRSAALSASWPFVLLLVVVFVGNEMLRHYREQVSFRSILFFFAAYAYSIFTLPILVHTISSKIFLESTLLAIGIFAIYLLALSVVGWKRIKASMFETIGGVVVVAGVVLISYFTGIIPPLPLALSDVGVYHSIIHVGDTYVVQAEQSEAQNPWWDILNVVPGMVHILHGEPLYVFSSVFAPTAFSTPIVHRWQWYDTATHTWETKGVIAFSIDGGRSGGYRGYSTLSNLQPGEYRVSIETVSGQVIGRIYFTIVEASTEPILHTEIH